MNDEGPLNALWVSLLVLVILYVNLKFLSFLSHRKGPAGYQNKTYKKGGTDYLSLVS